MAADTRIVFFKTWQGSKAAGTNQDIGGRET